jgi:hypothetical protein
VDHTNALLELLDVLVEMEGLARLFYVGGWHVSGRSEVEARTKSTASSTENHGTDVRVSICQFKHFIIL